MRATKLKIKEEPALSSTLPRRAGLMVALCLTGALSKTGSATPDAQAGAKSALRAFLLAVLSWDAKTLRSLTLPVSSGDFSYLMKGKPLTAAESKAARRQFAAMSIKALKPGDAVVLPGGRKMTVAKGAVGPQRAILVAQGAPFPFVASKVNNHWRVDAAPIIAARKAAERFRAQQRKVPSC